MKNSKLWEKWKSGIKAKQTKTVRQCERKIERQIYQAAELRMPSTLETEPHSVDFTSSPHASKIEAKKEEKKLNKTIWSNNIQSVTKDTFFPSF